MGRGAFATAAVLSFVVSTAGSSAQAQEPHSLAVPRESTPTVVDNGPNRLLLGSGLVTFGFAYVSSIYAAATSSADSDRFLFIPFAGPWIALGRRQDCLDTVEECRYEDTSDFLLTADGIVQAAGAIQIALAFFQRELRLVPPTSLVGGGNERPAKASASAESKPRFRVTPGRAPGGGVSVFATGTF